MSEIRIHGLKVNNSRVTNRFEVSSDLEQYIKKPEMFVEYDAEINADKSILNIPLLANVLPLAWLTGSNIIVDTLDKGFKESIDTLQMVFKKMLPLSPFTTEIRSQELVDNKIKPKDPERRTGLLFSGGVDSTYSLITNMEHKPRLVMHWGVEGPPNPIYHEYWEMVNSHYTKYANKNALDYNMVKTNARELLNNRKIEHQYHKELYYGTVWVRLQESILLLSLAAPLSMNRFDRFLIAASMYKGSPANTDKNRPHSAQPIVDESISWAGLKVKHDGFIPRNKKIKVIANHLQTNKMTLRVCLARPGDQTTPEKMNCNNCGKCLRTIMQLVQVGFNPGECGFNVDETTFTKIKQYYTSNGLDVYGENSQKIIPSEIDYDLHDSKAFFEWFRDFKPPKSKNIWPYRDFYDSLPYPLAKVVNKIYKMLDINVHSAIPVLPMERVKKLKSRARFFVP